MLMVNKQHLARLIELDLFEMRENVPHSPLPENKTHQ